MPHMPIAAPQIIAWIEKRSPVNTRGITCTSRLPDARPSIASEISMNA